jgi:AcrR family transcriptional regulator
MGSPPAATRAYHSAHRDEQARRTRRRVLRAATDAFLRRGYAGTTMRSVAEAAGVSVARLEQQFATKAGLLKGAIDVAIAGDDEEVPVLDRSWVDTALDRRHAGELLHVVAGVIGPAQQRSAGLVLAVFEGAATDTSLASVAEQMIEQRATTATWIVDAVVRLAPLRSGLTRADAVDTTWLLMDPAVFQRLVRDRGWSVRRYQDWFASSLGRLLTDEHTPPTNGEAQR